jgi:hypothetical protein
VVAAARAQGLVGPELARALDQARVQALCLAGWPAATTADIATGATDRSASTRPAIHEPTDREQQTADA